MWDVAGPLIMLVPRDRYESIDKLDLDVWKFGVIDYSVVGNPVQQYKKLEADFVYICCCEWYHCPWEVHDRLFFFYLDGIFARAEKWIGKKDGRELIRQCAWLFLSDMFW
jgi:hypothetical protein